MSLHLSEDPVRITGLHPLPSAVDDKVEVFHHNRSEQSIGSGWLHDRAEHAAPAKELDVRIAHNLSRFAPVVGIPDRCLTGDRQPQEGGNTTRQDESSRPGVDNPLHRDLPDFVWSQEPSLNHLEIAIV